MKLIVGLGNPGKNYEGTRHNVGFDVIDELARRWDMRLTSEKFHAWFDKGSVKQEGAVLLKPTTWMNRSGQAVLAAGRFYKLELEDLLVVADDMALPVGRIRMRASGSSGKHNGLQSIIDQLGSDQWCRLRTGIGEPVGNPSQFVTSRFDEADEKTMKRSRVRAADAIECWVEHGPELTMTRFNGEIPEV